MRAVLPLLAFGLAASVSAQVDLRYATFPKTKTVRELMMDDLNDPAVQVAIGITPVQFQLQNVRQMEVATRFALKTGRAFLQSTDEDSASFMPFSFEGTAGRCLFPFLNETQIAKLRRRAIRDLPAIALGTDEVAFALSLTSAQRAKLETIRLGGIKNAMNPKRPAIKALTAAFANIAAASSKLDKESDDTDAIVKRIDVILPAMDRLYRAFELAIRLDAKDKSPKGPDPLTLLTPSQRRRFQELSRS